MKKDCDKIACACIRHDLKRYKAQCPVILHYHFVEPKKGKKRDYMNIFAFADKVIEDSLKNCGVIKDDGPEYVLNTTHTFEYTTGQPAIYIAIEEVKEV